MLERRLPDIHSTSPLLQYASNVHSQGGEDGILDRLLQLVGTGPKHCIDIGAWDGVHLSNTRSPPAATPRAQTADPAAVARQSAQTRRQRVVWNARRSQS